MRGVVYGCRIRRKHDQICGGGLSKLRLSKVDVQVFEAERPLAQADLRASAGCPTDALVAVRNGAEARLIWSDQCLRHRMPGAAESQSASTVEQPVRPRLTHAATGGAQPILFVTKGRV